MLEQRPTGARERAAVRCSMKAEETSAASKFLAKDAKQSTWSQAMLAAVMSCCPCAAALGASTARDL